MIKVVMLAVLWAATGGILYLTVPATHQTDKFFLSVGALMLSQALLFVGGVLRKNASWGSAAAEADSGSFFVGLVYGALVIVLCLVALTPIPFNFLAVLHIVAALVLVMGWLFMTQARGHLSTERQSVKMTRTGAQPEAESDSEESPAA